MFAVVSSAGVPPRYSMIMVRYHAKLTKDPMVSMRIANFVKPQFFYVAFHLFFPFDCFGVLVFMRR